MGKIVNRIIGVLIIVIGVIQLSVTIHLLPDFRAFAAFKAALFGLGIGIKLLILAVMQIYILLLGYAWLKYYDKMNGSFEIPARIAMVAGSIYLTHVIYNILWRTNIPIFRAVEYYYLGVIFFLLLILIKISYPRYSKGIL
jgi:hypothetical protein